jgi:molybdopterin converting factor small subunit
MKVKVIAPFEIPGLDTDDWLEVPQDTRIKDILKLAKTALPVRRLLPVSVNGKLVRKSYQLRENDVLIFLFPFSGG